MTLRLLTYPMLESSGATHGNQLGPPRGVLLILHIRATRGRCSDSLSQTKESHGSHGPAVLTEHHSIGLLMGVGGMAGSPLAWTY